MPSAMTKSKSSLAFVRGLLPPARRLPDAINILPSPNSPRLLSINKTFAPCSVARTAAVKPARPAPTTRTSEVKVVMLASNQQNWLSSLIPSPTKWERARVIELRVPSSNLFPEGEGIIQRTRLVIVVYSPILSPLRLPGGRRRLR
jgi:hypothetical protein